MSRRTQNRTYKSLVEENNRLKRELRILEKQDKFSKLDFWYNFSMRKFTDTFLDDIENLMGEKSSQMGKMVNYNLFETRFLRFSAENQVAFARYINRNYGNPSLNGIFWYSNAGRFVRLLVYACNKEALKYFEDDFIDHMFEMGYFGKHTRDIAKKYASKS